MNPIRYIRNLEIKQKLLLLGFIPALIVVLLAQAQFFKALTQYSESKRVSSLVELAVYSSALVHELQKERGMSAGYLGSGGAKFGNKLPRQQKITDEKILDLNTYLQDFDADKHGERFVDSFRLATNSLNKITDMRNQIMNQRVMLKDALGFYTKANGYYLTMIESIATVSTVDSISKSSAAYAAFLQSKERAGIERAVLANTFAKDQFGPGMLDKLNSLITIQETYLKVFHALATPEQDELYEKNVTGNAIEETNKMRFTALKNAEAGGFGIDPSYWFQKQTEKINLLKKVEDELSLVIKNQSEVIASSSFNSLILSLLPGLLVAGVLLLTFYIASRMSIAAKKMRDVMSKVSKTGDFSHRVKVHSEDEIGDSAESFNKMLERIESTIDEVNIVVNGFSKGDFSVRVTADVEGDLQKLKDGVNGSAQSVESIVGEVVAVVDAISKGDFNQRVDTELTGDLGHLKRGVNESADAIANSMAELGRLMDGMAEGDFKQRINIKLRGGYNECGKRADNAMSSIDTALEDIDKVMCAIATGDIDSRVDSILPGQLNYIKQNLNLSLDTLSSVFDELGEFLSAIATGNLDRHIEKDFRGFFGKLKSDANETVDKLQTVVHEIRDAAESVRAGTEDIAEANSNLSNRTEQQAVSLEQTATSMDEITSTVQETAENASRANDLVVLARDEAEQGGKVVQEAVGAMQEINESSNRIAEIIGVIDEIAFQTNLLALNASVESARAGEQGRGFAVVASEVRNLAGRSATAAKEIKVLIDDSVAKVEAGSLLVSKSGETLEQIVTNVHDVSKVVGDIAQAADEQAIGIGEAHNAIERLQLLTQQNTAMVEEAAASSEDLDSQASTLDEMVGFFDSDSEGVSGNGVERRGADRPWGDDNDDTHDEFQGAVNE